MQAEDDCPEFDEHLMCSEYFMSAAQREAVVRIRVMACTLSRLGCGASVLHRALIRNARIVWCGGIYSMVLYGSNAFLKF